MGLGHILDANTLALWKFDENTLDSRGTLRDWSGNGRHVTQASASKQAPVRPEGPNGELVRLFDGTDDNFERTTSDSALNTACKGEWTVQGFFKWSGVAASRTFITIGGSNALVLRVDARSDGRLGAFWEASGVDQLMTQSTGSTFTANVWSHFAVVKNATHVRFFIDGVFQQQIARGTNANGGGSTINLGSNLDVNLFLSGSLKDLKLTSRALSDVEVAAEAALLATTFELGVEGDTLALWRCNQPADTIEDSSSNNNHLWPISSAAYAPKCPPLIDDGGYSAFFLNTYTFSYSANSPTSPVGGGGGPGMEAIRQALQSTTGFTFEGWFQIADAIPNSYYRGLFCFGDPGLTTATGNFLSFELQSDLKFRYWSEYGTDADSTHVSTYALPSQFGRYHIACRRNATIAGKHSVDIFVNGVLVDTLTNIEPYAGGQSMTFGLGRGAQETYWYGCIDDVRLSSIPRTDAEILESYQRGVSLVAPVIGSPTPAEGAITTGDAISFTATDADEGLTGTNRVTITAEYGSDTPIGEFSETVYVNGAFTPKFDTDSTAGGTGGSRPFSIEREGGWPSAEVTITVCVVDVDGNVAVETWEFTTDFEPVPDDTGPPTIENITPADGNIRRYTVVEFDVLDDQPLVYTGIVAEYDDAEDDVVFDGFEFGEHYQSSINTRTAIEGGYHFKVRRDDGWKHSPNFKPAIIDGAGNIGEIA